MKNKSELRKRVEQRISMQRTYSSVDLIRFHRFALEKPDVPPYELVQMYREAHPEKSASEKIDNVLNALKNNNHE